MAPVNKHGKPEKPQKKDKNKSKIKNNDKVGKKKDKKQFKNHQKKFDKKKVDLLYKSNRKNNVYSNNFPVTKKKSKMSQKSNVSLNSNPDKPFFTEEQKKEMNSRTIFVGNLPTSITRKKLKKLFSKYGPVDSARLSCSALNQSHLPRPIAVDKKDFNPKVTSMNGLVKFKSQDTVIEALKANGSVYEEHYLRVDRLDSNKCDNFNNSVFLGNLPFDITDNEVRKHFEDCGSIESVHVIRDSNVGIGKGFGYVNFMSAGSVELALKMDGTMLKKRDIRVKRAIKRLGSKRKNEQEASGPEIQTNSEVADEDIRPKKKKEKKKKKDNVAFQGNTAKDKVIKKKKSIKKLKNSLQKKKLIEILGKDEKKKKTSTD